MNEALKQMNERGMEHVSTYDMARALGIRQSNITYYFATRADIVNALAKRLIEDANAIVPLGEPGIFSIASFYEMVDKVMRVHQRYKFLLMNYASIITADKELNDHFAKVLKDRPAQFEAIIKMLDANGYVNGSEMLAHSTNITLMLNIIAIYWVQEGAIYLPRLSEKAQRRHYLRLFFQAFIPYLTAKGKKQLETLL